MRKKEIAIVAFTMFIVFTLVSNHIGAEGNESKISRIAEGMQKQDVQIDEWSLYSKKNVDKKTISEVKLLTDQHRQYTWTYEEDNDVFKAIGVFVNREKNVIEKLQILTALTNNYSQSYILYEVKGEGVQSNWNKINDYFNKQAFDIFNENVTTFACINGTLDDKMKVGLYQKSNELLNEFEANPVEQLREHNFLSVSAKTSVWEDFIPTNNGEMNIQIALRNDGMGDITTVVIGTPIITSEY
ncbi:MAG: YwmB family TATA-box binding protein [Bacillota bacterium]